jgi:hypothetical protein
VTDRLLWFRRSGVGLGCLLIALPAAGQDAADPDLQSCITLHEQAQVDKKQGRLRQAQASLRGCARPACPMAIQADCYHWLEQVIDAIPTVVFSAEADSGDVTDIAVYANEELVARRLDGKPVELDPGIYQLRFERPDSAPVTLRAVLREGERARPIVADFRIPKPRPPQPAPAPVPLSSPPPPQMESYRPIPIWTFILGGVAIGAAGSATYLGLTADRDYDGAMSSCAPLCSSSRVDGIRTTVLAADVSMGLAIAAAGAAVVFYVIEPVRRRPVIGHGPVGQEMRF